MMFLFQTVGTQKYPSQKEGEGSKAVVKQVFPIDALGLRPFIKDEVAPLADGKNESMKAILEKPNKIVERVLEYAFALGLVEKGAGWTDKNTLDAINGDAKAMAVIKMMIMVASVRGFNHMKDTFGQFQGKATDDVIYASRQDENGTCAIANSMVNHLTDKNGEFLEDGKRKQISLGAQKTWTERLCAIGDNIAITIEPDSKKAAKAGAEAKQKADDEAKRKADDGAKAKADSEAKQKADDEAKMKAEEDARRSSEQAKKPLHGPTYQVPEAELEGAVPLSAKRKGADSFEAENAKGELGKGNEIEISLGNTGVKLILGPELQSEILRNRAAFDQDGYQYALQGGSLLVRAPEELKDKKGEKEPKKEARQAEEKAAAGGSKAQKQADKDKAAKELADKQAKELAARQETERKAKEQKAQEQAAKDKAAKEKADKAAADKAAKELADKQAKELSEQNAKKKEEAKDSSNAKAVAALQEGQRLYLAGFDYTSDESNLKKYIGNFTSAIEKFKEAERLDKNAAVGNNNANDMLFLTYLSRAYAYLTNKQYSLALKDCDNAESCHKASQAPGADWKPRVDGARKDIGAAIAAAQKEAAAPTVKPKPEPKAKEKPDEGKTPQVAVVKYKEGDYYSLYRAEIPDGAKSLAIDLGQGDSPLILDKDQLAKISGSSTAVDIGAIKIRRVNAGGKYSSTGKYLIMTIGDKKPAEKQQPPEHVEAAIDSFTTANASASWFNACLAEPQGEADKEQYARMKTAVSKIPVDKLEEVKGKIEFLFGNPDVFAPVLSPVKGDANNYARAYAVLTTAMDLAGVDVSGL